MTRAAAEKEPSSHKVLILQDTSTSIWYANRQLLTMKNWLPRRAPYSHVLTRLKLLDTIPGSQCLKEL